MEMPGVSVTMETTGDGQEIYRTGDKLKERVFRRIFIAVCERFRVSIKRQSEISSKILNVRWYHSNTNQILHFQQNLASKVSVACFLFEQPECCW